jgi:hypothetical protein
LSAVTVDGGGWEVLVDQEVRKRISHALGLNENESKTSAVSVENIQKNGTLVHVLNVFNLLGNVLGGRSNTTNRQEDIILQEISSQHLDVAGEGGGKHESLTVLDARHVLTLNDSADLWFETHVQHTISLVKNQVLDVAKGDAATLDQVDKTTWGSDEKITSTLDLAELGSNIGSTVDNAGADPRSVSEFAGLIVNLGNKLTGRSKDQGSWVGLALTTKVTTSTGWCSRWAVDESLRENGEQETTGLSGTSLGTSHQISAAHNNRNRVFLDRGWDLVVSKLDVLEEVIIQRRVGELQNWLGDILA